MVGYAVVGGGVLVSLALGLFRLLGERWLGHTFDKRLDAYRHERDKDMERLRFEIAKLTDRSVNLHHREFDVIPNVWAKLLDAYHHTGSAVSPLQSYPNLDTMTPAQLDDFLAGSPLPAWKKQEIAASSKKLEVFIEAETFRRLNECKALAREALVTLKQGGIFIPKPLFDRLQMLLDIVFDAIEEQGTNAEDQPRPRLRKAQERLFSEGRNLQQSLLDELRTRMGAEPISGP